MDFSNYHNPYDFANPVTNKGLFFGRKEELNEINYYLNHATKAPRPINIALLGPRASGKTSLLNMAEIKAKDLGFCTTRIELDESDAASSLNFFFKLFDGILSTACTLGAFNGLGGKTYDTYLDIVNTFSIPEEKLFCPFIFPLAYAKAMSKENYNVPISDLTFKNDLLNISAELGKPIAIFFDECNVLAKCRIHLEKLRNIFMNLPGYMLFLTGTLDLFPIINDVFSPIIRQFKKINIDEFKDKKETEECIKTPLIAIGIKPSDLFQYGRLDEIEEIHKLSNGRPYEIQLICHILFRRIQENKAKKLKIDLSVLESIRYELETSQDLRNRPLIDKIRNLNKKNLSALGFLCICEGIATFDQLWEIEYIMHGEKHWRKDELIEKANYFINSGILAENDQTYTLAGDDFDRIYAKYYAREKGAFIQFRNLPLYLHWLYKLNSILIRKKMDFFPGVIIADEEMDLSSLAEKFLINDSAKDPFSEGPPVIQTLCDLMIDKRNRKELNIIEVQISTSSLNTKSWVYPIDMDDVDLINTCHSILSPMILRANELDGELLVEDITIPVVSIDKLIKLIQTTENVDYKNHVIFEHEMKMVSSYLSKDKNEAKFHATILHASENDFGPSLCNNLGYLYLASDELDIAKNLLIRSIKLYSEANECPALPRYNLSVLELKCGNVSTAIEGLTLCIEELKDKDIEDDKYRKCACLIAPKFENKNLLFEELEEPDLFDTAQMALDVLNKSNG